MKIEFVGLPGVGKTTLSQLVVEKLKQRGYPIEEPHKDLIGTSNRMFRNSKKLKYIFKFLFTSPEDSYKVMRLIFKYNKQSVKDKVKLLIYYFSFAGIKELHVNKNTTQLYDEGIFQVIWAVGLLKMGKNTPELIQNLVPEKYIPDVVVFLDADKEKLQARLTERDGGGLLFRFLKGGSDLQAKVQKDQLYMEKAWKTYEGIKNVVKEMSLETKSLKVITVMNSSEADLKVNSDLIITQISELTYPDVVIND